MKLELVFNWWGFHACPISLRMRRYFNKRSKDGKVVASQEALKLWQSDEGRVSDECMFPAQQLKMNSLASTALLLLDWTWIFSSAID